MSFNLQEEVKKLPEKPGVYLMIDSQDLIIYVGKAKILKNRLKQYFQKGAHNERVTQMIRNIKRFEYIVTDNEYEALVLELNLIKKHKPKYNVLLKDAKGYAFIKITVQEDFPRILLARRVLDDGNRYFGPYYSNWIVKTTIEALNNIFPLRKCNKNIKEGQRDKPCLNYHIGLCLGPCASLVTKDEYGEIVKQAIDFLSGKSDDIKRLFEEKMLESAKDLEFERAAIYRERLRALEEISQDQKMASLSDEDFDVIALSSNEIDSALQIFFIRGGKVIGRDNFFFTSMALEEGSDLLISFIKQFYGDNSFIPPKIYIEEDIDSAERDLLNEWLTMKRGHKCRLISPKRGEKYRLAQMVKTNANIALANIDIKNIKALEALQEILKLEKLPLRIEAYDISNLGTSEINASRVVYEKGRPKKDAHRRYKLEERDKQDDYGAMEELLTRRFSKEDENDPYPELVLLDGGIGHLNIASKVLGQMKLDLQVLGMVKDDKHKTRGLVGKEGEYSLKDKPDLWRFISAIQNEAHRFAIEYNRKLTDKRYRKSPLDEIEGIGKKRKISLYKHFGSLEKIKVASYEDLLKVEGMSKSSAENVYKYFKGDK